MSAHAPGTRLGPYTLIAPIGAGGMGEVWKALDTRLDRTIALKFSTTEFTARFEQEARTIAGLNHPHICQLYDVGPGYLVMEFIDGRPLKGALPIERALDYAAQILDALQAAHSQGIVHRDLKPGNILVASKGLKLLDFGLAKQIALASEGAVTQPVTAQGEVVGTLQYMSPEQLQGRPVDQRSDLFSFGCVLYEMLSGTPAFASASSAGVIAAILEREPPLLNLPPPLERIIRTCLAKDPNQRFQSAIDLKRSLLWAMDAPVTLGRGNTSVKVLAAISVALAVALASVLVPDEPAPEDQFAATRLTSDEGLTTDPAVTLDGKLIAFASDRAGDNNNLDIYVQQAAGGQAVRITSEPGDDHEPAFSPDGSTIVFRSEREGGGVFAVPALGGPPRLLVRNGHDPRVSPDGRHVAYATTKSGTEGPAISGQLFVIPMAGGEPRLISPGFRGASFPIWISDRTLVFVGLVKVLPANWWVVDLDDPRPRETFADLPVGLRSASWNPVSSDLLFVLSDPGSDGGSLWTIPVDPRTGKAQRPARRLTLAMGSDMKVAVAGDGSLITANAVVTSNVWSLPLTGGGAPTQITFDASAKSLPAISPDGRYLTYVAAVGGSQDVFLRDLRTGGVSTVSPSPDNELYPLFSGTSLLAFARHGPVTGPGVAQNTSPFGAVFAVPVEGGPPRLLTERAGRFDQLSDDGRYVVWHSGGGQAAVVRDLKTNTEAPVLRSEPRTIYQPRITPDGGWIVFLAKTDATDSRIYGAPFRGAQPIPESEWIPLTDGKAADDKPRLTPDRRRLYFTSERDGFRCVWAQDLDPDTLRPRGDPAAFFHSHNSRRSMRGLSLSVQEISVGGDQLIFNTAETTANLWKLQPQPHP